MIVETIDTFLILFCILVLYVILLFLLRFLGIGAKKECEKCKNCCPDCNSSLQRIKRKKIDHLLFHFTLRLFAFKRYSCDCCQWEGLRWEKPYKR